MKLQLFKFRSERKSVGGMGVQYLTTVVIAHTLEQALRRIEGIQARNIQQLNTEKNAVRS